MNGLDPWEGNAIPTFVVAFAQLLITILLFAIVLRAVISWFPINPRSPWVVVLNDITEPILAPLRRVVPQLGMIDITPMVAMIVLLVIQRALAQAG